MPLNPIVTPIIGAVGDIIGQAFGASGTKQANWQQRQFAQDMYFQQRRDSLSDWNMQNEYNSPAAQMARLRAAGLNPNLVYGNGAQVSQAQQVRSASAGSSSPNPVSFNPGSTLAAFQDASMRQAQTDNLKAQNTVLVQEAASKAVDIMNKIRQGKALDIQNEKGSIDLKRYDQVQSWSLQSLEANVRKLVQDTNTSAATEASTLSQMEINKAQSASNLREAAQRVLESRSRILQQQEQILASRSQRNLNKEQAQNLVMQRAKMNSENNQILQQIKNLEKDEEIKKLDINLKRFGIQPGDALWQRVLARVLDGSIPSQAEIDKMFQDSKK